MSDNSRGVDDLSAMPQSDDDLRFGPTDRADVPVEPSAPLVEATKTIIANAGAAKVARVLGTSEDLVLAVAEGLPVPLGQLLPYADALREQLRREATRIMIARALGGPDRNGGRPL